MPEAPRATVVWSHAASIDLEIILAHVSQRNPERAKELFQRLKIQMQSLSKYPERGRFVPETMAIGLDIYREFILTPYRVVFRVRSQRVGIMGFFDGRRDLQDILFDRLARI